MIKDNKDQIESIGNVKLDGETINNIIFANFMGADKMYLITKSGKVVILPVSRLCPVQIGTIDDLKADIAQLQETVFKEIERMILNRKDAFDKLELLKNIEIRS